MHCGVMCIHQPTVSRINIWDGFPSDYIKFFERLSYLTHSGQQ